MASVARFGPLGVSSFPQLRHRDAMPGLQSNPWQGLYSLSCMWKKLGSGSQTRPVARPCFGGVARPVKLRDSIVAGILSGQDAGRPYWLSSTFAVSRPLCAIRSLLSPCPWTNTQPWCRCCQCEGTQWARLCGGSSTVLASRHSLDHPNGDSREPIRNRAPVSVGAVRAMDVADASGPRSPR